MRWNPRRILGGGRPGQSDDSHTMPLARLVRGGGTAAGAVETVGFWAAVVLPLCYVPLLLTGLSNRTDAALLGLLVALHLVALGAGHAHNRD